MRRQNPEEEYGTRRWPLFLTIGIVVVLLAVALFVRLGKQDERPASQGGRPDNSASQAEPGPGGPAATGKSSTERGDRGQTGGLPVQESLAAFAAAYYRYEPGDTAASRRARFESARLPVAPGLLPGLNFEFNPGADQGLAPFDGRQRLTGKPTGEYQVTDVYGDGKLLYVVAAVNVVQSDQDGKEVGRIYVMTASNWSKDNGGWVMTAFNDTYQQAGGP